MNNKNIQVVETTHNGISLDEELVECIQSYDNGLVLIKHPLCNSTHHPDLIETNNNKFRYIKKRMEELEKQEEWVKMIWDTERPWRLDTFMKYEDKLTDKDYWETLGDIFMDTEFPFDRQKEWLERFSSKRKERENLVGDDDWDMYHNLPEKIQIWRGVNEEKYLDGMSWSLDKEQGEWFSRRFGDDGLCVEGYIHIENILMCSVYENQIVCNPNNVIDKIIN